MTMVYILYACEESVYHIIHTTVIDMDSHDREILQSILNDGNYDISDEDRAALKSCVSDFYQTTN